MAQKTDTPWVRIAQSMPNHPKIMPLSDKAFRTLVEMICYSAQYELDGKLPAGLAERLWNMDALDELMTNSSTAPSLAKQDSMYVIHGYEDMQETSNEIAAKREILRENGRKGGRPTGKPKPNDNQAGFATQNQNKSRRRKRRRSRRRKRNTLPPNPPQGGNMCDRPRLHRLLQRVPPARRTQRRRTRIQKSRKDSQPANDHRRGTPPSSRPQPAGKTVHSPPGYMAQPRPVGRRTTTGTSRRARHVQSAH